MSTTAQQQLQAELQAVSRQRDELLARLSEPLQQLAMYNGIIQALTKALEVVGDEAIPPEPPPPTEGIHAPPAH